MSKKRPEKSFPPEMVSAYKVDTAVWELGTEIKEMVKEKKLLFDFFSMMLLVAVAFNGALFVGGKLITDPTRYLMYPVLIFFVVMFFAMMSAVHEIMETYAKMWRLRLVRKMGLAHKYHTQRGGLFSFSVFLVEAIILTPFVFSVASVGMSVIEAGRATMKEKAPMTQAAPKKVPAPATVEASPTPHPLP